MTNETDSLAEALTRQLQSHIERGNKPEASDIYLQLRGLSDNRPGLWKVLGHTGLELGYIDEALDFLSRAVDREPADHATCFRYCQALARSGRHETAIELCTRLMNHHPDAAELHVNLANSLRMTGRTGDAVHHSRRALVLQPDYPAASIQLAISLQTQGSFDEAISVLESALEKHPNHPMLRFRLANLLVIQEKFNEALDAYRAAISSRPGFIQAWYRMAGVQLQLGHLDESLSSYRQVRVLQPDMEDAAAGEAGILMMQGHREAALGCIQPFIDNGTENVSIIVQFAELMQQYDRIDAALALVDRHLRKDHRQPEQTARLHFSAGNLHARLEQYDTAFDHYLKANTLKFRPQLARREIRRVRSIQAAFPKERLASLPRASLHTERPIFIVGMPRSGTSLVEQILACHPAVFGAGELMHINRIAATMPEILGTRQPYPQCIERLSEAVLDALASDYLQQISALNTEAAHVTDKMPHNFLNLGLIDRLFPGARVIHCQRDPMDTCLSCFTQDMAGMHAYSNDLATLGEYYRAYRELMLHWHDVLHIPVYDIQYEALVTGQETATRELLMFCGLDWDEQCLRYHESTRVAATASHDQVRQPVYTTAIGNWRRYRDHLKPLTDALGVIESLQNDGN